MDRKAPRSRLAVALVVPLAGVMLAAWSAPTSAGEPLLPIVFVHGGAGSAAQYQSQAMRFSSNGYPNVVTGIDRTSSSSATLNPMLDAFFDAVMAQTGDTQIYVVSHSLGTTLMNNYLNSSAARSARVAKYIAIDGATGANCPGNPAPVNCMGIFGQGNPARMLGPNNVHFPDHGHTQTVTSALTFVEQYKFLTGAAPATTLIIPEPPEDVVISGRMIYFPANTGVNGATVDLWEVDGATGHRVGAMPVATFTLGADGNFGPVGVHGKKHYEFQTTNPEVPITGHYYFQPFIRSDSLIRLLASPPGSTILANTATSPDHTAAVLIRYKEWWNDQGAGSDTMLTTTTSPAWDTHPTTPTPPTLDILENPAVAPRSGSKIGMHDHDASSDKVSTLEPIPFFAAQIFQTGTDIWMPATEPPDGTISFVNHPRGDTTRPQTINVANWASASHRLSIQFNDWAQDICGDEDVTGAEACDEGAANGTLASCCSATCQFQSSGTACDDGDACTADDACDGGSTCVGGAPPSCDDGNACTADSCPSPAGCVNDAAARNGFACSDADVCTQGDVCSDGECAGTEGADSDGDGYCDASENAQGCNPNDGNEIPPQASTFGGSPVGGAGNFLVTYLVPTNRTIQKASDPSCASAGVCAPGGFCSAGKIADPCEVAADCNQPANTCRVVANYAGVADLAVRRPFSLNRIPIASFEPLTPGCSRKVDLALDPARRSNVLKINVTGTVGGNLRRDADTFKYR